MLVGPPLPTRTQLARIWQKNILIAFLLIAAGLILLSAKQQQARALARKVLQEVYQNVRVEEHAAQRQAEAESRCPQIPGAEDVLVVMKTGATEAHSKLPRHFSTTFRCIPHYTVFSDLSETIAGHEVYDILDILPQGIIDTNRDEFRLYFALQAAQATRVEASTIARPGDQNVGWNLDKWKFLPMIKKAYDAKPDAKWFIFLEADTFMMWSNMLRYLSFLDPNVPEYRGGPAWFDVVFAHGGSGIIMSAATMKIAVEALHRNESYYGWPVGQCCGDLVLSKFLADNGVNFTSAYPLIQGENPATLDYTKEKWCRPVLSYHHVDNDALLEMWRFEQRWLKGLTGPGGAKGNKIPMKPILHRDIFDNFLAPLIENPFGIDEWNNLSRDTILTGQLNRDLRRDDNEEEYHDYGEDDASRRPAIEGLMDMTPTQTKALRLAHTSLLACERACLAVTDCKQYAFKLGECRLGNAIRLGMEASPELAGLQSRWIQERVEALRVEAAEECLWWDEQKVFHTEN